MAIDIYEIEDLIDDETSYNIQELFSDLLDTRYQPNVRYPLNEIFFLVLCAQLCGYESFREYEAYGHLKLSFLRRFIPYENGIPSHKTIRSILAIFCPSQLEDKFRETIKLITGKRVTLEESQQPETIAIDGKRHRGLKSKGEDSNILHTVSAYSTKEGVLLGQSTVADKSNEITAIPELLDALEISGQIVTIDAMGCQAEIAKKIRTKGADYILALKGNQGYLYDAVQDFFNNSKNSDSWYSFETENKGHGRKEKRQCMVVGNLEIPEVYKKWEGLTSIIKLISTRELKDKKESEERYYISSLDPDPKKILTSIRRHWGVENEVHWYLDVVFREDDRIIWNKNIASNESTIRRLAMSLLKKHKAQSESSGKKKIAMKTLRKNLVADDHSMEIIIRLVV